MRPILTAVIAALESASVALLGLAVIAVPAVLLWVVTFDLSAQPSEVFAGSVAVWFLAHFVPLTFELSAEAALGFGLPPEVLSVPISLAPLGITLITALLAARSGWRFGHRGGVGAAGVLGGALGFAGVALIAAPVAGELIVWPLWLIGVTTGLTYGIPAVLTFLTRAARDEQDWWSSLLRQVQRGLLFLGFQSFGVVRRYGAETIRIAAAAVMALIALSGLGVAIALTAGYVDITSLSQGLQMDPFGAILMFVLQLVLLPIAIIWTIAWLTGEGFAIGAGTSVSPFDTLLGPMPNLPLFGALPAQGWGSFSLLAPAIVVVIGIVVGLLATVRDQLRRGPWVAALAVPVLGAAVAGLVIAGLSVLASGAIGPDRLAVTGAHPWITGGLAAAEIGAGMMLGIVGGRIDRSRLYTAIESVPIPGRGKLTLGAIAERRHQPAPDTSESPNDTNSELFVGEHRYPAEYATGLPTEADTVDLNDGVHNIGREPELNTDAAIPDETIAYGEVDAYRDFDTYSKLVTGEDSELSEASAMDAGEGHEGGAEPGSDADGDVETDELLRAYSWDQLPDPIEEPEKRPRKWRGWRKPGR
ncbi:MAG: cell division protein PerM [Leucobacter sp.]